MIDECHGLVSSRLGVGSRKSWIRPSSKAPSCTSKSTFPLAAVEEGVMAA